MAITVSLTITPVAQAGAGNDTGATKRIEQDAFDAMQAFVNRFGKSVTAASWSGGTITSAAYTSGSGQLESAANGAPS